MRSGRTETGLITTLLLILSVIGCSKNESPNGVSPAARDFADEHWTYYDPDKGELGSYLAYEFWVAKYFGPDGNLSGTIIYNNTIDEWYDLSWGEKSYFLPQEFFTKSLGPEDATDDYFYGIIGTYDQFGAGLPPDGDDPLNFRVQLNNDYQWTASNSYRTSYLNLTGG